MVVAATLLAVLAAVIYIARPPRPRELPADPVDGTPRIVSMAPNLTEILFVLGLEHNLVAVSSDSDDPPAAQKLPKIGTFWQPDLEAVVAYRPTLVVTLGFQQQSQMADKLRSMGIETLTVNIESIGGLTEAIEKIGRAAGAPQAAEELMDRLQREMDQLYRQYAGRPAPRVLWVIQRSPLRAAGKNTFITELLELLGAVNAMGPTLHQYPPIDAEQVLAARPDIIIEPVEDVSHLERQRSEARRHYSRFKSLPAVQNDRIYLVDGDLVSRLGPRLPEGLKRIAELIWPEESSQEPAP